MIINFWISDVPWTVGYKKATKKGGETATAIAADSEENEQDKFQYTYKI